jgi:hypothetical protein
MHGIQVADKITLDDTKRTDRGPVIKVKAVLPVGAGGSKSAWYGLSVKGHKLIRNGEEFEAYLGDFSDADAKPGKGGSKGWMRFVDAADRKRWEAWKAEQGKKDKE